MDRGHPEGPLSWRITPRLGRARGAGEQSSQVSTTVKSRSASWNRGHLSRADTGTKRSGGGS